MALSGVRFPVTNVLGLLRKATPPPVGAQKNPPNTLEYLQVAPGGGGTFGNTVAETGTTSNWADWKIASRYVLSESGDISKLTFRLRNDGGSCYVKAILYGETGGALSQLIATGTAVNISASQGVGWVDLPFASDVNLSAGTYWLGIIGDASCGAVYLQTGSAGTSRYNADTYSDGAASPFGAGTDGTYSLAVYAAYTTAGASTVYPATGQVDSSTAASGTATVKRAASGVAGAVVTGLSAAAFARHSATGSAGVVTALSGSATKKCPQTGTVCVVTSASAAALAKHFATASASVVTTLSGTAFRRHPATGTVNAVSGSSATPTTKRAATGSAAAVSGLSGTATAKHPVAGIAGAVVTGTSGTATVKRRTSGTPSINVVTGLLGAATVTNAPTGTTGHVDAVTGLSGRANVTRAASGSVTSSTTVSGSALARHEVTGNVSSTSGLSGSVTLLVAVTGSVDVVTGISGTPRGGATTYPASGRINVVTTICDATVYATIGLISSGSSRGMGTPGRRSGLTSTGVRGIAVTAAPDQGCTSEGHERTTR